MQFDQNQERILPAGYWEGFYFNTKKFEHFEFTKNENWLHQLTVSFNDLMQLVDYCVIKGERWKEKEKRKKSINRERGGRKTQSIKPTLWRWAKNAY
jgi:hypothetical protein